MSFRKMKAAKGSEKIKECIAKQRKNKGERFDMCKALDDLWNDAENRGIEQGVRIFILDNHMPG